MDSMVSVRPCSSDDLARLLDSGPTFADRHHHTERFAMQDAGEAIYLVAWECYQVRGRCTVLRESKYSDVRQTLGPFPEINALEARPTGHGVGTALLRASDDVARNLCATQVGLAVEETNRGALRLYERLGYTRWEDRVIIDRWRELREDGSEVEHANEARYMIKALRSPVS